MQMLAACALHFMYSHAMPGMNVPVQDRSGDDPGTREDQSGHGRDKRAGAVRAREWSWYPGGAIPGTVVVPGRDHSGIGHGTLDNHSGNGRVHLCRRVWLVLVGPLAVPGIAPECHHCVWNA